MSSLVVGGVPIKVAVSSPRWTRSDAVDRARAFDNTFRASQTGGAVRTWDFETPAVLAATEGETYKAALSTVASQLCSGDIIAIPTMCSAELTDGVPTKVSGQPYVVLSFSLHEVQPAKVLLRYTPGDTITGESFTRSTVAFYMTTAGVLVSAAINAKRDNHFTTIGGTRSLLREDTRTNGWTKSQEFDHADWLKQDVTVVANLFASPDGTVTVDRIVETATTSTHGVYRTTPALTANTAQATSVYATYGERVWLMVQTFTKAGVSQQSWVNLQTGLVGTKHADHTILIDTLVDSWRRVTVLWNSGTGATAPEVAFFIAPSDNVSSYLGDVTKGLVLWGAQHETDKPFASSYIPTTTAALARGADLYSLPFTAPPAETSIYAKFVERASPNTGARVFAITSAADAMPELICYGLAGKYSTFHGNGVSVVDSTLAAANAIGDTTETVSRLFGDGSVDTTQSLNGAAATASAQTAALALAVAWSAQLAWIGSSGTAAGLAGFFALQSFKIVSGSRSLVELRAI